VISDAFAADREVILFNNAGIASSGGTVPDTVKAMARDAIGFIGARPGQRRHHLALDGGLVAQEVAIARPDLVRRLVLAYGAAKDPSYRHLESLRLPVLVVNGTNDIIITTINSYILQQFLPNAELILYPDANHGSRFQYPGLFARHARIFLDG
jgi:pimeloyl-ACP methyl ester carboxylesterase